jgi:hypothetical protein
LATHVPSVVQISVGLHWQPRAGVESVAASPRGGAPSDGGAPESCYGATPSGAGGFSLLESLQPESSASSTAVTQIFDVM